MERHYKQKNLERARQKREEECRQIIAMTPEKALDAILDHETPGALVQSFPHEDLYFLMYDIGIDDFLPVLSLASSDQWEYFLDIEIWDNDRLDIQAAVRWMGDLMKAAPQRTINWLFHEKLDFMELVIARNIELVILEENEDPSDLADDFITYDNVMYVRVLDHPVEVDGDTWNIHKMRHEERKTIIMEFLEILVNTDYKTYQGVLLESMSIIFAETEEERYRLKNVRLGEKGFLPYEEAVSIYSMPKDGPDITPRKKPKSLSQPIYREGEELTDITPVFHFNELGKGTLFSNAVTSLDDLEKTEIIQPEFAALCNQIISADRSNIKGREELAKVVRKVCGYISIGMETFAPEPPDTLLRHYTLNDLFRQGYAPIARLKHKADHWLNRSWFRAKDLTLNFWDEEGTGVIGGMLIDRPLFFDNYRRGTLYREFETLDEINRTEQAINEIIFYDKLFFLLDADPEPFADFFLTFQKYLLTLWAGNSKTATPIELDDFKHFFTSLWAQKAPDADRRISNHSKERFLQWLSDNTGLTTTELSDQGADIFESLFRTIELEMGRVDVKALDPRYITLFYIKQKADQDE